MKKTILLIVVCQALLLCQSAGKTQSSNESPEIIAARRARDHASVEDLQRIVSKAQKEAAAKNSFEAYLRLALFELWMCEAAEARQDNRLFKQAAQAGVAAAEKAVALNPKSSDARQLLGDLLSQLIPHVYGGGMRYGQRSTDELDKAIELDPKNVNAYVSRAISYYYTPESFGGGKSKAFEMLKKAVEVDSLSDSPHIWLAIFHLDSGRRDEALSEINLALRANPDRVFTKHVRSQIINVKKSGTKD
jgi:tetratricopeptide (TPR) repeat protein